MTDSTRGREPAAAEAHWAALARYLGGDATHDQRAYVERWAAASDANRAELAELRALWQLTGVLPSPARVDELWRRLAARMQLPDDADVRPPSGVPATEAGVADVQGAPRVAAPRREVAHLEMTHLGVTRGTAGRPSASHRRAPRDWALHRPARHAERRARAALAAAVMLLVGGGFWWRAATTAPAVAGPVALAARDVTTADGQRLHVRLEDGTAIDLAPGTRLRVRPSPRGAREVELRGEALFTVTHDPGRPFVVRTRGGLAEDLGTTFTVRAPEGGAEGGGTVRVVVLAGLVSLRAPHAPARDATPLRPGQRGTLDTRGVVTVESDVDTAAAAGWARGRLLFRQATLGDVADAVGRWYGAAIRIPDPADARRRLTLDMPARPLGEVLGAITVPLRLRAVRRGRTVVLTAASPP